MNVSIRPQLIADAKRYYEILNNTNFRFFSVRPGSIEAEKRFLRTSRQNWQAKKAYNFSILCNGEHIGAVGVQVNQSYSYIGEVGYFIDEKYWGNGIVAEAVRQLEVFIRAETDLTRLELFMAIDNKPSERVAIKCGYQKEGTLSRRLKIGDQYHDSYLYAKILWCVHYCF